MKNRKGLSSVIGAVLLIFISVAAAGSAWTFVNEIQSSTQDNIQDQISQDQRESRSELSSDLVYNSSHGYSIITLRNTGSITLPLIEDDGTRRMNIYVRGRPIENGGQGWTLLNEPEDQYFALEDDETVNVNTTEVFPDEGDDYTIRAEGPFETSTTYVCYNSGTPSC